ncbi:LysR family transcriptional regulator [Roseibium sp.]|uniref:LysR family transcriptional regulator n=1 Tax=Roseibium sp. TaxID=1936156 RepID=UPI003B51D056
MKQLPPLNALPAFEATARLGSMSAAADELGRTHGAISKQLAHLGEQAGVPLFRKDGQGVTLTPEGEEFARSIGRSLDDMEAAWQKLTRHADSPSLDIGISATFAMRWLMPRLPRFYQKCPDAQVNFRMTGKHWLEEDQMDAILTWDRLRWQFGGRTDIEVLGDVAFGIVHAPGLDVEIDGKQLRVKTRCVQELPGDVWQRYQDLTGVSVEAKSAVPYPHTFLVIEAALAGFGAALVEKRIVADELADGRLVAPFGFEKIECGFGAIVSQKKRPKRLAKAFLDWLREEAAGGP